MGDVLKPAVIPLEAAVAQQHFYQLLVDRQEDALERRLHTLLIRPLLLRRTGDDEVDFRAVLVVAAVHRLNIRGLQRYQGELERHIAAHTLRAHIQHVLDVLGRAEDVVDVNTFGFIGGTARARLGDDDGLSHLFYHTLENILNLVHRVKY